MKNLVVALLLLFISTSPCTRADITAADVTAAKSILSASDLINERLDALDELQGPHSVAYFSKLHKDELESAAQVLEDNDIKGIKDVIVRYEKLRIQSFANTLSDLEKAEIRLDLARLRSDFRQNVLSRVSRLVPPQH